MISGPKGPLFELTEEEREFLDKSLDRILKEYSEVIKKLSKE